MDPLDALARDQADLRDPAPKPQPPEPAPAQQNPAEKAGSSYSVPPLGSLKPRIVEAARQAFEEKGSEAEAEAGDAAADAVAELLESANYGVVDAGWDGSDEAYVTGHDGNQSFRLRIPRATLAGESDKLNIQFGPIDAVISQRDLLDYWADLGS